MNILVADDNEDTLTFLEEALKEEGFLVDAASDGAAAMAKALSKNYDVLVLDNLMPGKTGLEICERVRKLGRNSRIIILSVNGETDVAAQAIAAGADDYMNKPFSFTEFSARLDSLMRRPENVREEILKAHGLSLNARSHAAKFRERQIKLSPKEFELLAYLLRNRGKVIKRMEILEHVWDMNADPTSNTVEMHISNTRKKLERCGAKNIIRNVPRAGYIVL